MSVLVLAAIFWPAIIQGLVKLGLIKQNSFLVRLSIEDSAQPHKKVDAEKVKKMELEMAAMQANIVRLINLLEQLNNEKEETGAAKQVSPNFLEKEGKQGSLT